MEIVNLSAEPLGKLYSWLPQGLKAERIVFLPDACPGKSPLPTGTAVLTHQVNWRRYAIADCGCGMRLLDSGLRPNDITIDRWNRLANLLRANKGKLGDLGGGNHFLDALVSEVDGRVRFLIHTGSRNESGLVDAFVDSSVRFDAEFSCVVEWAQRNRATVQRAVEDVFGDMRLVLDLAHNTYEVQNDGAAIIRKGSVHVRPGDVTIIPSHLSGQAILARATDRVQTCLFSLSHGTGRKMSRSECKPLADHYDFAALRKAIMLPEGVQDASLRTEGPFAYRDIDECLMLLDGYIEEIDRYSVIAYMGHLYEGRSHRPGQADWDIDCRYSSARYCVLGQSIGVPIHPFCS